MRPSGWDTVRSLPSELRRRDFSKDGGPRCLTDISKANEFDGENISMLASLSDLTDAGPDDRFFGLVIRQRKLSG